MTAPLLTLHGVSFQMVSVQCYETKNYQDADSDCIYRGYSISDHTFINYQWTRIVF